MMLIFFLKGFVAILLNSNLFCVKKRTIDYRKKKKNRKGMDCQEKELIIHMKDL